MNDELMRMVISLQADTAQLKAGLAQAESAIKGVDDSVKVADGGMKNMIGTLKNVAGAMGLAFATSQIASFAKDSIMAASNMAESLSKVRVVFGEGAAEVEAFGKSAAENLGISNQAALEAAGTYGNLFQAFGLGQGQAQEMSTSLVQLAADMASFNNTSIDDAITALRSGLSGETEPLKRFGVALSEARLKNEALALGLIKSTKEALTPAAKSQAAYALIMKDTTLAQGDYARTADGTANTMKTLQAKMADAKVALGDALLPAFKGLLKVVEKLIPLIQKLGNFIKNNQDEIKAFAIVIGIATTAWTLYIAKQKLATLTFEKFNQALKKNAFVLIVTAVALLVAALVKAYKNVEWFRNAVNEAAKFALKAFAAIIPIIGKVYEAIAKIVTGPMRLFLTALSKLPGVGKYAKAGLDLINKGLDGISDLADGAAKKANELAENLGKVNKENEKTKKKGKDEKTGKDKGADTGAAEAAAKAKEEAKKRKDELKKLRDDVKDIYKDMNDVIRDAQLAADDALRDRDDKIADAQRNYRDKVEDIERSRVRAEADALRSYNQATAEARANNVKVLADIARDYRKKIEDLEEANAEKIADLRARANEKLKDLEEKYQEKITDLKAKAAEKQADIIAKGVEKQRDLVEKSMDRLRSAFAQGVSFSLAEGFKESGTAGGLLDSLKKRLTEAQSLAKGSAELAARGYSQTFIEQIAKAGTGQGLKMIDQLLLASPEQQAEIQKSYADLEVLTNTGLNGLAETMNQGANLATAELREAYKQAAVDVAIALEETNLALANSLGSAADEYAKAVASTNDELNKALDEQAKAFDKARAEAAKVRDERLAEAAEKLQEALDKANEDYQEALRKAKENYDQALEDAAIDLARSLRDVQISYERAIDEINIRTQRKVEELRAKLTEIVALINQISQMQGGGIILANAPVYTPITAVGSSTGVSTGGTGTTTVNNFNNTILTTNLTDPNQTSKTMIEMIKYGQVVQVASQPGESASLSNARNVPKVEQAYITARAK